MSLKCIADQNSKDTSSNIFDKQREANWKSMAAIFFPSSWLALISGFFGTIKSFQQSKFSSSYLNLGLFIKRVKTIITIKIFFDYQDNTNTIRSLLHAK